MTLKEKIKKSKNAVKYQETSMRATVYNRVTASVVSEITVV